jgi:ABC-type uncharacterized transport system permease subunit
MRLYIIGILARILGIIIPLLLGVAFLVLTTFVAYNINFVANQFIFTLKTNSLGNQLHCFLNKRWFFDKIFNEFIVDSTKL